ncbi:hypothetical protein GGR56DRAFT_516166 [Xylariaceae sp. FL0804]|nr:hypothetical protein GGR56DRAFT_516166 [Xylariaceae sp. FL0804]
MKSQVAIATILSAASALASPANVRRSTAVQPAWTVTDFTAECTPRSLCSFSFFLSDPSAADAAVLSCAATASPLGVGGLPAVFNQTCSGDGDEVLSWDFVQSPDDAGWNLDVDVDDGEDEWYHFVPADQVVTRQDGAVVFQEYVGPLTFVLDSTE